MSSIKALAANVARSTYIHTILVCEDGNLPFVPECRLIRDEGITTGNRLMIVTEDGVWTSTGARYASIFITPEAQKRLIAAEVVPYNRIRHTGKNNLTTLAQMMEAKGIQVIVSEFSGSRITLMLA